ncbi:MAG: pyruvate ferredoxin oxidoreductase [Deltaproteobacteria bacterium]|nr:pyruvate ferredoxin oxidoreductase [Deltaproteobacteria bacterium]
MKRGIEVSLAAAEAAKLSRVEVVAAYPITPQTHIVEHLSELVADGEMDAVYVTVESEHSAMSACIGAAASGARTFTSTSAQGLELMHETLFIASALRLPIVMAVANRALSAPLSIWNDHSDVMAARDCGWIQLFCENGQEVVDSIIMAYRIAEDNRVLLPVMVNLDGFLLSHVVEPIDFPSQKEVDKFLPDYKPLFTLHPDRPVTMGAYATPELYTEAKFAQEQAILNSLPVIKEVFKDFTNRFKRKYNVVETYNLENSDTVFVAMGSINENIMTAIDELKKEKMSCGLVKIRLFRPFPFSEIASLLEKKKNIIVIDRAMPGGSMNGPVFNEISAVLRRYDVRGELYNYIVGLGGRDVLPDDFISIYDEVTKSKKDKQKLKANYKVIGVRV